MDYEKLGFRAGLEIHQQLDTHKLFCGCPSVITDAEDYSFERRLVPTTSELGDVDAAAVAEAKRGRRFRYVASFDSTCLVEADEEPPHVANEEAIDISLTVALLFGARVVDEIHFMRKIVIDGSNTGGFQRTALVALGGEVDGVRIETICLEEDAARRIGEAEGTVTYGLDRLGIPLVEIATAPEITSPGQAEEVAARIGSILRATGLVRRGIGTIRQDLNVSIAGGSRVEIKGVQELNAIHKILENEVERQLEMLAVRDALKSRSGGKEGMGKVKVVDISDLFSSSKSKTIIRGMKEGAVMGIRLPAFGGLIGGVKSRKNRLGREFAAVAETAGGGIMHSDELPNYGISAREVESVRERLGCRDVDAFVLSIGKKDVARRCLEEVFSRAMAAFDGVPGEVRKAMEDGTTRYMRPLPGAERMYPETDVPPVSIDDGRIERIRRGLPEMPEDRISRYESYGLGREAAGQIVNTGKDDWFDYLVERHVENAGVIARVLLNTLPELEKDGVDTGNITVEHMDRALEGLEKGMFSSEGVADILSYFSANPESSLEEAVRRCGLSALGEDEVRNEIKRLVKEHKDIIGEKGERAVSTLMGIAMKKMRGRADASLIHRILTEEIDRAR